MKRNDRHRAHKIHLGYLSAHSRSGARRASSSPIRNESIFILLFSRGLDETRFSDEAVLLPGGEQRSRAIERSSSEIIGDKVKRVNRFVRAAKQRAAHDRKLYDGLFQSRGCSFGRPLRGSPLRRSCVSFAFVPLPLSPRGGGEGREG